MPDYKTKSYLAKCLCSAHMLEIERFVDDVCPERGFNFLIWDRCIPILGFIERLQWCCKIITTGEAYANEVILNDLQARKAAMFILECEGSTIHEKAEN